MQSIHNFHTHTFIHALKAFFTELHLPINYLDDTPTDAEAILKEKYNPDNKAHKRIEDVYVLGLVDDAIFEGKNSLQNIAAIQNSQKDYDGLLIFGITLTEGNSPTRSLLAEITRAFNQAFPHLPLCIVFRYENFIAFANSERIGYKQTWRQGEKIGKVTMLKDIDIHKPHTAHNRILQDLQLKANVKSFAALNEQWLKVLTTKELNNQFFKKIANWYFWAVANTKFPYQYLQHEEKYKQESPEKLQELANQKAMIRFITRIIFVWFLKEKKLVSAKFFDKDLLAPILKDFDPEKGANYYLAILQNLFFATLNRPVAQREFAPNKDFHQNKKQYDLNSLFRYEELFQNENLADIMALFADIPFLNGGLFDCLDKKDAVPRILIDGFSRETKWQAHFPNFLLFGEPTSDFSPQLNDIYQTKKAKYEVKGLFRIFEEYKFTIEENTPDEQDIALDPVLLGEIFENLLAYYNPETATTARKGTGSFYTPQEIVNYMVDESLKAYLGASASAEESLSSAEAEAPKREALINRLANIKILDPACGSGAFPMGILHKMVQLLKTLDPDNKIWQKIQKQKLLAELDSTYDIQDKTLRDTEIQKLNDVFEKNLEDYGRKLYLIRNCIYGVDIQDVAIQISKLRFFLSLVIDQNNDNIQPLPNLETKFVVANTLIGVDLPFDELMAEYDETWHFEDPTLEIKEKLKKVREQHFTAANRQQKKKLKTEDERLRKELTQVIEQTLIQKREAKLAELYAFLVPLEKELTEIKQSPPEIIETSHQDLLGKTHTVKIDKTKEKIKKIESRISPIQYKIRRLESHSLENKIIETAQKLAKWDIYDQNAQADWFDSDWMFGIKEGFDVVIGNPPYVRADHPGVAEVRKRIMESEEYETLWEKWDLYVAFMEKGFKLLAKNGVLSYIIPDTFLTAKYAQKSHSYFVENALVNRINFLSEVKIFEASVKNIIIELKNSRNELHTPLRVNHKEKFEQQQLIPTQKQKDAGEQIFILNEKPDFLTNYRVKVNRLEEICYVSKGIVPQADEVHFKGAFAKEDLISDIQDEIHPKSYIEGKWIKRYEVEKVKYFEWNTERSPSRLSRPTFPELYSSPKIIKAIMNDAIYDEKGLLCNDSCILAVLWSELSSVENLSINNSVRKDFAVKGTKSDLRKFRDKLSFFSKKFSSKYILAILNSKFGIYFLNSVKKSTLGRLYPDELKQLPIPAISKTEQQPFIALVEKILHAKQNQADTQALESEIDRLVYRLYDLTDEEIAIIEGHNSL